MKIIKIIWEYLKIGNNCKILTSKWSFGSEPYLIEIGNNVEITSGVRFITHDGGAWIFREKDPTLDVFGKIKIGNNVFIGVNTVILPNIQIGNNVVIGAGSIVTKDIPSNTVVCGVPAKVISSIEEYYSKLKKDDFQTKGCNKKDKEVIIREKKPEWFI